jgi:hypothetical protein
MGRIMRLVKGVLRGVLPRREAHETGPSILEQYVKSAPSPQHALDIFKGEWWSQLPAPLENFKAGDAGPFFEDHRIRWLLEQVGGVNGQSVLELGPAEAAHTWMLEKAGAASVLAVEANTRAYLKCLIIKELFNLQGCRFLCGDFVEFLRSGPQHYDLCVASGVLYHQPNPVEALDLLSRVSDKLFVWTHVFDPAMFVSRPLIKRHFPGSRTADHAGFRHTLHRYEYKEFLQQRGFCGGSNPHSNWLSRADLLGALKHFGYRELRISFDEPEHPNCPAIAVLALR